MTADRPFILVTGFRPFGLPGRPSRPENASETVLRSLEDRSRGNHPFVVLPVDPRCEVLLARALDLGPAGVVATGEAGLDGSWDTNVEGVARDLPVQVVRPPERARLEDTTAGFIPSTFAGQVPLLDGMDRADRIGAFWCNRAYFRVLQWCRRFERPGVFLHLRVDGDRARQARHVEHVLGEMQRAVGAG
jgi:pyrrolidone-carboxylate peptidase